MKKWWVICSAFFFLLGCGTAGSLTRTPEQDKDVLQAISKLAKSPGDATLQKAFESFYAEAVLNHQRKITEYKNSNQTSRWERIMSEYNFLNKLADAVQASSAASKLVQTHRYDEQYAEAKQNAIEAYYDEGTQLLQNNDREAAKLAYEVLEKANRLSPNYKDTRRLLDVAYNKSVLNVVIMPVNYYRQSFGHWGLQNDYVQQEIVRDLRFQLGSNNVKVFTDYEARGNRINPDRIIELNWDQLYLPTPYAQTSTREVSKEIETGKTADKQPIYTTVKATIYITRQEVQASGNLSCRVTDANRQTLLWDNFPANYTWVQERATYRGDSRALGSYEWALINNSRMANYSRRDIFTQVFRQVYPQLVNRIRSISW